MAEIIHQLLIRASKEKIFEALTSQNGVKNWWTKDCDVKAELGYTNVFRFGDRFKNEMKVVTLKAPNKVEWLCTEAVEDWMNTKISFDLEGEGDKIFLNFKHAGWAEANSFFANCNFNWGRYLMSLKQYCETGTGSPY